MPANRTFTSSGMREGEAQERRRGVSAPSTVRGYKMFQRDGRLV